MDIETFIVAVFCLVDDVVRDRAGDFDGLRRRGPAPVLADSEVLRSRSSASCSASTRIKGCCLLPPPLRPPLPGPGTVHRTTFARQAANLGP